MEDPVYNRIESQPRPSLFAASGFVLLAALGLWLSELALGLVPDFADSLTLENAVYYLPFIALPMALYARRHPGLGESTRLKPMPVFPVVTVALLALLSVYVASALSALWGAGLDALGLRSPGGAPMPATRRELMLSILTLAAMPAICEELLFRGFVLAAWESRGTWLAVGVSTALFALLHGNLYGLPAYLLVGAVAGFVTFTLDSVYASIVYHTIYNTVCLVIPYLMAGQDKEADAVVSAELALSIALETAVLLGLMAMAMMTLWLRAARAGLTPIPRIRRPLNGREHMMLLAALLVMTATLAIVAFIAVRTMS